MRRRGFVLLALATDASKVSKGHVLCSIGASKINEKHVLLVTGASKTNIINALFMIGASKINKDVPPWWSHSPRCDAWMLYLHVFTLKKRSCGV